MFAIIDNERGVSVAAALLFLIILATLGFVALALVVEEMYGAVAHADSEAAFAAAQAGLSFGVKKLSLDSAWAGLPAPGKPVGRGSFTVAVGTTDENGAPLPGGQRMVRSTGRVGAAVRDLRQLVGPGSTTTTTVHGSALGNAVTIQSQKRFLNIANIIDGTGPNGTWGHGGFNESDNESGIFTGWGAIGAGTIVTVEAVLYGYVTAAMTNDQTTLRVYFNNVLQGSTFAITTAELNTHVGSGNAGYWYKDVTAARSWAASDFTGDLELYVLNDKVQSDDGPLLYLDYVGLRVTVQGSTGTPVSGSYKEITL
jgi:hypothetical protein